MGAPRDRGQSRPHPSWQAMTIQSKKAVPVTDAAPSAENSKSTLVAKGQDTKPRKRLLAELGLSPILPNANTARCFPKTAIGDLDLTESPFRPSGRPVRSSLPHAR